VKKLDTYEDTRRIWDSFSLVIRAASFLCRTKEHVKIKKIGYIPKPPYILICTHASFMDFFVAIKATMPHKPYWISTVEEYIDKDFIFRSLGVLPKRKFTNDPRCAKMAMDVLTKRKKILIIYPEARYSFVGKQERIDNGLAKMAKICNIPIVMIKSHGHYLRDPQWGDHHKRKLSCECSEMKCLYTRNDIKDMDVEEISEGLVEQFVNDDEQFQLDHNILITYPNRAEGIERILYKCPHCGKEFEMSSKGDSFKCDACGEEYRLNEDGTISNKNGESKFTRVSDWYYWEKDCVKKEVEDGTYFYEDDVRVEHLKAVGIGFVPLEGKYHLTHTIKDGITITSDNDFSYNRSSLQSYAIHLEYDYKNKGGCLDLPTNTETYFVYPLTKPKNLTKIHFAVEIIYDYLKNNLAQSNK